MNESLTRQFPGYWIKGAGAFVVICHSARRITLFTNLDVAKEAKFMNCGWGCDRIRQPHNTMILDAAPVESAPVKVKMYRD